jgi:hypothetical protein
VTPPRIPVTRLSSGLRGLLRRYEASIRGHEEITVEASIEQLENPDREPSQIVKGEVDRAFKHYDRSRQALLRKLVRLENGINEGDIEQLKRDFRKVARAYHFLAADAPDAQKIFPNEWRLVEEIVNHRRRL